MNDIFGFFIIPFLAIGSNILLFTIIAFSFNYLLFKVNKKVLSKKLIGIILIIDGLIGVIGYYFAGAIFYYILIYFDIWGSVYHSFTQVVLSYITIIVIFLIKTIILKKVELNSSYQIYSLFLSVLMLIIGLSMGLNTIIL